MNTGFAAGLELLTTGGGGAEGGGDQLIEVTEYTYPIRQITLPTLNHTVR